MPLRHDVYLIVVGEVTIEGRARSSAVSPLSHRRNVYVGTGIDLVKEDHSTTIARFIKKTPSTSGVTSPCIILL